MQDGTDWTDEREARCYSVGCLVALLCLHAVVALCCVVDHLRESETENASDNDDEMR